MKHNQRTYIIDVENTNHPIAILDLDVCDGKLLFTLSCRTIGCCNDWARCESEFEADMTCQKCGHTETMTICELEDFLNESIP